MRTLSWLIMGVIGGLGACGVVSLVDNFVGGRESKVSEEEVRLKQAIERFNECMKDLDDMDLTISK